MRTILLLSFLFVAVGCARAHEVDVGAAGTGVARISVSSPQGGTCTHDPGEYCCSVQARPGAAPPSVLTILIAAAGGLLFRRRPRSTFVASRRAIGPGAQS